jgi:hypothetical protein
MYFRHYYVKNICIIESIYSIFSMPNLYTIYKKHEKKLKYALYIPPEQYDQIFDFLKKCEDRHNYIISTVQKIKYSIKQGTFSNYDSGIIVFKNNKNNQTTYEYIKNCYIFVENTMNMNKENQLEKYAPIVIDIDDLYVKSSKEKKKKKDKEKHKHKSSMRNTLESILETIEEEEDDDSENR